MSRKDRFRTLGRDAHRHGRLAVTFEADAVAKKLYVNLIAARELNPCHAETTVTFFVRVQMLPHKNPQLVADSLFNARQARVSHPNKKASQRHRSSTNVLLEEEFVFDLLPIWKAMHDHRIYFCVLADGPVAPDGSGFAGCTSFGVHEVVQAADKLPRWFWLLSKTSGLYRFEPVKHEVVYDKAWGEPDVIISGRAENRPNALINGQYAWNSERHGGRHTYKHRQNGVVLYFHPGRGAWAIADSVGGLSPYAFCVDKAATPGEATSPWSVFNRGREFVADPTSRAGLAPPRFETDLAVNCKTHREGNAPAAASVMAREVAESPRALAVNKLITGEEGFIKQLRLLERFSTALRPVLPSSQYDHMFGSLPALITSHLDFLGELHARQQEDPLFTSAVGDALDAGSLQPAHMHYLAATRMIEELSQTARHDRALSSAVARVEKEMPPDCSLPRVLRYPPQQLLWYPNAIREILRNTPEESSDYELLSAAVSAFERLASQAAKTREAGPSSPVMTFPPPPSSSSDTITDAPVARTAAIAVPVTQPAASSHIAETSLIGTSSPVLVASRAESPTWEHVDPYEVVAQSVQFVSLDLKTETARLVNNGVAEINLRDYWFRDDPFCNKSGPLEDFLMMPGQTVTLYTAPGGKHRPVGAQVTTSILWTNPDGSMRKEPVLQSEHDVLVLMHPDGRDVVFSNRGRDEFVAPVPMAQPVRAPQVAKPAPVVEDEVLPERPSQPQVEDTTKVRSSLQFHAVHQNDEVVPLFNRGDRPINLRGYCFQDAAGNKSQTLGDVVLQPQTTTNLYTAAGGNYPRPATHELNAIVWQNADGSNRSQPATGSAGNKIGLMVASTGEVVMSVTVQAAPQSPQRHDSHDSHPPWLHPSMPKEEFQVLFDGAKDGTFAVRPRDGRANQFVLGLMYKRQLTLHLIAKSGEFFTVNKKTYGSPTTLAQCINHLRLPQQDWPQRLSHFIPHKGADPALVRRDIELIEGRLETAQGDAATAAVLSPNQRAELKKEDMELSVVRALTSSKDAAKMAAWKWTQQRGQHSASSSTE